MTGLLAQVQDTDSGYTWTVPIVGNDRDELEVYDPRDGVMGLRAWARLNNLQVLDVNVAPELVPAPPGLTAVYQNKAGDERRFPIAFLRHWPDRSSAAEPMVWIDWSLDTARDLPDQYESMDGFMLRRVEGGTK